MKTRTTMGACAFPCVCVTLCTCLRTDTCNIMCRIFAQCVPHRPARRRHISVSVRVTHFKARAKCDLPAAAAHLALSPLPGDAVMYRARCEEVASRRCDERDDGNCTPRGATGIAREGELAEAPAPKTSYLRQMGVVTMIDSAPTRGVKT